MRTSRVGKRVSKSYQILAQKIISHANDSDSEQVQAEAAQSNRSKGNTKKQGKQGKTKSKLKTIARKEIASREPMPLEDAVEAIYETPRAKFDETLEVAMNLGIDPRHADQQVRGTVTLPHGTGKILKVAVFARDEKAEQAKKAGADIVGAEELAEIINKGEINFDRCIATPDMMGLVGRLGKILGPRNLMPNPKLGTVANNVAEAVAAAKGGEVQFRAEKNGVIHAGVGRMSFSKKQLCENVSAFFKAIVAIKPEGAKGTYIKKITIATTMGAGIPIDSKSL